MTQTKKRNINLITLIGLLFCCLLTAVFSVPINTAFAEVSLNYTNVLSDLEKDPNFNKEDYPVVEEDHTLQVITIAESSEKELFVYVYQSCWFKDDLRATSINISTEINNNFSPKNYDLIFINSNGVFGKYKVANFEVKTDVIRYYEIPSIFRKWLETDKDADNDNTIDEVSFEVGLRWKLTTTEAGTTYFCENVDTIKITSKYVGFIRYQDGAIWAYSGSTDSHYIAFSTDRNIDKLTEADVYYVSTPICAYTNLTGWHYVENDVYGVPKDNHITITENDILTNDPHWLGPKKYIRERIETVKEFLKEDGSTLKEEVKNELKDKQFILRFCETKYESPGLSDYYYWTEIEEVTILRLMFETDGVTYNLGVVDNKQTGSIFPDNQPKSRVLKIIVSILVGLAVTILVLACAPLIAKLLDLLLTLVASIITFPFKIFKKEK